MSRYVSLVQTNSQRLFYDLIRKYDRNVPDGKQEWGGERDCFATPRAE